MFVRQINKQTTKRRTWEGETDNNHSSFISELWLASLLHPCQWDEVHRDHLGQLSLALHPKVSTDFFRFPKAHTVTCSIQGCYLHILLPPLPWAHEHLRLPTLCPVGGEWRGGWPMSKSANLYTVPLFSPFTSLWKYTGVVRTTGHIHQLYEGLVLLKSTNFWK